MKRIKPEIEMVILAQIRAGSLAFIAAESAGVPRPVFRAWLQAGQERSRGRYHAFWLNIRQARAQARAKAQMEARAKDVKFWLRYGPGKAGSKRPAADQALPELFQLLGSLAGQLDPFPEARQAILHLLDRKTCS